MAKPTPEAMAEYKRRLQIVREAAERDELTAEMEQDLVKFMIENGLGEEG